MRGALKTSASDSYMHLIKELPLRKIRSAADHARAKKMILRLSKHTPDRGASEYLDVLVELVAEFERKSAQDAGAAKLSAAELVRHRIEQRGISINALAHTIGVPQSNLSEMLSGRRGWSKAAIRALCDYLNIRAERFFV